MLQVGSTLLPKFAHRTHESKFPVFNPSVRRAIPSGTWYHHQDTSIPPFWMACPCKTLIALQRFFGLTWPCSEEARCPGSEVPVKDLWSIQDIWTAQQSYCMTLPATGPIRIRSTGKTHLISCLPQAIQRSHIQISCTGDYTRSIQMFGTTDSYTTQVVSKLYTVMCNSWLGMNSPRVNLLTDSSRSFIRTPTRTILLWGLLHMSGGLHMFGSSLIVLRLKRKSPKPRYWMTHCQNITISCTLYHAMHSTLQVSLERIDQILQWRWVKVQHTLCPLILTPAEFYTEDERPLAILTTWWWIWWRWTFFHWWWAQWSPDHWWFEPGHSIYCPAH